MEGALAKADSTFQHIWSKATFRDRAKIVGRAASLMLERKESLARLATLEMGKRISEGRAEVEMSAAILQYYANHAETFLAPQVIDSKIGDAHLEFSPLGVLIGVQPWNFPYYQLARFFVLGWKSHTRSFISSRAFQSAFVTRAFARCLAFERTGRTESIGSLFAVRSSSVSRK